MKRQLVFEGAEAAYLEELLVELNHAYDAARQAMGPEFSFERLGAQLFRVRPSELEPDWATRAAEMLFKMRKTQSGV